MKKKNYNNKTHSKCQNTDVRSLEMNNNKSFRVVQVVCDFENKTSKHTARPRESFARSGPRDVYFGMRRTLVLLSGYNCR